MKQQIPVSCLSAAHASSLAHGYTRTAQQAHALRAACLQTAIVAIRSLHAEIVLFPKPGLVSLVDNGSHADMNAALFMRSLFSLRHYFVSMAHAGARDMAFGELKALGMHAEQRMLAATHGVNTHRGAIFALGMLCAAAGYCHAHARSLSAENIRQTLIEQWGNALKMHSIPSASSSSSSSSSSPSPSPSPSNGLRVAHLYAVGGAREEAAKGFPAVFEIGLPQILKSLGRNATPSMAQIDALFALMAYMTDTNIYHRGGAAGARLVKLTAQAFIAQGGTAAPAWQDAACACHRLFVSRHLSPGGAADMLAASWFAFQISASHTR